MKNILLILILLSPIFLHGEESWPSKLVVDYRSNPVTLHLVEVSDGFPHYTHPKLNGFLLRIAGRLLVKHEKTLNLSNLDDFKDTPQMPILKLNDHTMWTVVQLSNPQAVINAMVKLRHVPGVLLAEPDFLQLKITAARGEKARSESNETRYTAPQNYVRTVLNIKEWPLLAGENVNIAVIDSAFNIYDDSLNIPKIILNYNVHRRERIDKARIEPRTIFNDPYHGNASLSLLWGVGEQAKGLAPQASAILIERAVNWSSDLALALQLAQSAGADIIACPWTLRFTPQIVSDALDALTTMGREGKGAIVVAAAGNQYFNIDDSLSFAAEPNVLVINALSNGQLWPAQKKQFNAILPVPYLINFQGRTLSYSGTSSASVAVSGVIASLLSIDPALSRQEIEDLLRKFSSPELEVQELVKYVVAESKSNRNHN
ncbi:S8 family serine peptidase [Pseudoalteromonas fenneropenaei]|uniref:S8 family serine peptidase n=1 Tax=Pseudoalteromonas fenneropenaei TaxID=1737459 RepID=A0ABV7CGA0_9GAMM